MKFDFHVSFKLIVTSLSFRDKTLPIMIRLTKIEKVKSVHDSISGVKVRL